MGGIVFRFQELLNHQGFVCGAEFFLKSAVANFRTSFVMCAWCSVKSSTVLMWTPSILYDLLGRRYLIDDEPSGNVMV